MEVRQRPRPTGEQWFDTRDLATMLMAFGDDTPSLQETIRVLDIIAVEYDSLMDIIRQAITNAELTAT